MNFHSGMGKLDKKYPGILRGSSKSQGSKVILKRCTIPCTQNATKKRDETLNFKAENVCFLLVIGLQVPSSPSHSCQLRNNRFLPNYHQLSGCWSQTNPKCSIYGNSYHIHLASMYGHFLLKVNIPWISMEHNIREWYIIFKTHLTSFLGCHDVSILSPENETKTQAFLGPGCSLAFLP